jgi:N-acetylmuramoyl-L-alanine amidase
MARQFKAALEQEMGVQVYLTRDDDQALSLTERTELANALKADLFISFHAAGAFSKDRTGFRVYYQDCRIQPGLSVDQTSEVQTGLVQEWDVAQAPHAAASHKLAEEIDRALSEILRSSSRGPIGLPLTILAGAGQPAVLIEVGTLTNAEEERRLKTKGYRDALTTALLRGVRVWRHWYESGN